MRFNEKVEGRRRKTEFDLAEFVFEKEDHRESKNPEYRVIKFFFFLIYAGVENCGSFNIDKIKLNNYPTLTKLTQQL